MFNVYVFSIVSIYIVQLQSFERSPTFASINKYRNPKCAYVVYIFWVNLFWYGFEMVRLLSQLASKIPILKTHISRSISTCEQRRATKQHPSTHQQCRFACKLTLLNGLMERDEERDALWDHSIYVANTHSRFGRSRIPRSDVKVKSRQNDHIWGRHTVVLSGLQTCVDVCFFNSVFGVLITLNFPIGHSVGL